MEKRQPKLNITENKLKPLQPTLRERKRFVRVKITSDKKFDFKTLSNRLSDSILYFLGAIDFGKGGVWFIKEKFDEERQEILIRVGHKFKDKLLASLLLIDKIDRDRIKIEIISVSGTIKGCYKEE